MKPKIDDIVIWKSEGQYKVLGYEENSRTKVEIEDIERGEGWSDQKQRYIGVKIPHGWYLGKNNCFGEKYTAHIKDLEIIVKKV